MGIFFTSTMLKNNNNRNSIKEFRHGGFEIAGKA